METLKNILNCNRAKLLLDSPGVKLCMCRAWQVAWEEEELGNRHLKNSEGVDLFIHDMNTGGTDEATHDSKNNQQRFLNIFISKVHRSCSTVKKYTMKTDAHTKKKKGYITTALTQMHRFYMNCSAPQSKLENIHTFSAWLTVFKILQWAPAYGCQTRTHLSTHNTRFKHSNKDPGWFRVWHSDPQHFGTWRKNSQCCHMGTI